MELNIKYKPQRLSTKRKNILKYIIDDTIIKVGSEFIWLWVDIELQGKEIVGINKSKERNMFVAEKFMLSLIKIYYKYPVPTADETTGTYRRVDS